MKVVELHNLLQAYGNKTIGEIIEAKNMPYKCPKCEAKGYTTETYDAYPKGFPDSGWATDIRTRKVDCDLCCGHGYTAKEYKPKYKTELIGYE
jgi:hypothetical protein